MIRALLTGSGGFCGRHLSAYLADQGVDVRTMGSGKSVSTRHFRIDDVTDIDGLARVLEASQPDFIFHLAGMTVSADPVLMYRINTEYAVALLRAIRIADHSACAVMLVGTSAEYGMVTAKELPIREDLPAFPYNDHGISKLAQTFAGLAAAKEGLKVVVVRPFNIIGPGMPRHLVLQSFASQVACIMKGEMPPVISTGNLKSSRDFIDVMDAVRIYWELIRKQPAYGQIVNVCTGKPTFINSLLARLIEFSGMNMEIRPDPARFKPIDVPEHYGSLEKLHQLIVPFEPTSLDVSLERVLDHYLQVQT